MRIKPLPPLKSLVAFEAAARHLSFTQAAEELCVTQGAVSRQILLLEGFLGCPLFIRDKRALSLTVTGLEYFERVQESLMMMAGATSEIVQWKGKQRLTVVTTNAMASFWLLPRFNDFQEQYPNIDIRILAVDSLAHLHQYEFDLALFYCRTPPTDMHVTPLFSETVFPVCSPIYLEKNPCLHQAGHLSKGTLLSLEANENWVTWQDWLHECGLPPMQGQTRRINMNNYPLLIQAALNGQGIALAWRHLVDDYLNSGLLVSPVSQALVTTSQFYMLEPITASSKQGVNLFRQWLLTQVTPNNPSTLDHKS